MVGGNRKIAAAAELRQDTGMQLDRTLMSAKLPQTDVDVRKLVHELQAHQIGLEMQNAELLQIRADLESSLARYTGLYDFAPVSYFTLTSDGLIQEANLTAAALLGAIRADLMGQRLEQFVAHESQAVFRAFLKKVFFGSCKANLRGGIAPRRPRAAFCPHYGHSPCTRRELVGPTLPFGDGGCY